MSGTIIMPIAGRSSRFPNTRPKWMLTAPTGELMLEKSLRTVAAWSDQRVVIGALAEHLHDLGGQGAIRRALGDKIEIIEFEEVTAGPAATVNEIIKRADISGPIFIKDCDSWFSAGENLFVSGVCFADLRRNPDTPNIPGKSFVKLNENGVVTGIYEKIVCSNNISVGGYGFRLAEIFMKSYDDLVSRSEWGSIEPFVSHVVLEAIQGGEVFRGIEVRDYVDVGTLTAWQAFRDQSGLYIVDIDGVVVRNAGAYLPPLWSEPDELILENVEALLKLVAKGAQLIFVTARPEKYREKTEAILASAGLSWLTIIYGVNHCRRTLINDFATSNPYPSAVAVNLPRNSDKLGAYLD